MPLPVRYIDSQEYREHGAIHNSLHGSDSPVSFPLLEKAVSTGKLQALGVHNVTSVIRQLGSLAKHAESVMGDIADILVTCHQRTVQLEERTKHLSENLLSSLDADKEACEGFVIPHPDFHFKSDRHINQQLLSKRCIPQALLEQVKSAYTPALYRFNTLWDDGRNAMHLYSNPDFFFEHWRTSMKREAMRRKSTMDALHVTSSLGQTQSKGKGESKKQKANHKESFTQDKDRDRNTHVRPVGGSKSLKRNTRLSKSFHGHHDRSRHNYGSSLTLQDSSLYPQSKRFRRTYSFRAAAGSSGTRYSFRKDRSKLHSHFSKATAANFDNPLIELSVPSKLDSEGLEEDEEYSIKGSQFRRPLSTRDSGIHSRSRSPNPRSDVNDSVFTGMHMYTVEEELNQQEKSTLSTLSKQQLLSLDLATSDFQACLSIDSGRKLSSTFTPPSCIFARSITPILSLVNVTQAPVEPNSSPSTQPQHPRREPPPIPTTVPKPSHSSPNPKEYNNKLPKFRRSATISAGNPIIKKTAENLKKMYMSENGRPASVALVEDQLAELLTPINANTSSLSSLNSSVNSKSDPPSSLADQPHRQPSSCSLEQSPNTSPPSQTPTFSQRNSKPLRSSIPNHSPIPGPPPPPRNDSLNNTKNPVSSGPSTPVVTCPTQRHSSLDKSQKESITNALSNVLKQTRIKELPNSPDKSLSPSSPFSDAMFSVGNMSPRATGSTDSNHIHKVLSPKDLKSPDNKMQQRRPPLLVKQGSLYISPRKLSTSGVPSLDVGGSLHKRKAGQILKAGGVDSGDLSGSRSNLLEAIRKGIQLRKVEEVDEEKKYEEAAPWDVAAILERYQVLHSDNDSDSEEELQDWDDFDDI